MFVCWWFESYSQLQSIHLTLASVQYVQSVPSSLWIDESQLIGHWFNFSQHCLAICSGQSVSTHDQHWKFCFLDFLTQLMRTVQQFINCFRSIAQVFVFVRQVAWGTNVINSRSFLVNSLENSRVENWSFSSWIDADQKNEVGILNAFDLWVENVICSEVVGKTQEVCLPEFVIKGI